MERLPRRPGDRPATTPTNPHRQLDQQPADTRQRDLLATQLFALPGIEERESIISVPGARALWLTDAGSAPVDAFLAGSELAHLHAGDDQSLHAMLPPDLVDEAIRTGWAEQHPAARRGEIPPNAVMLYAPRSEAERVVIASLVTSAWRYANGT